MKICIITPFFDPWIIGGVEKYATTLAIALSKNHKVIVITTAGPKPRITSRSDSNPRIFEIKPKNIASRYDMAINSLSVGITKKLLWHFLELWNLSAYSQIAKILNKEKPEIIHTHGVRGFSPALFSAVRNSRIPHIHTMHDYELISPWSPLYRKGKPISRFNLLDRIYIHYMRRMSSSVSVAISPSKFLLDFHVKLGFFKNSKKLVIPNGLKLNSNTIPKYNFGKEFLFLGQIVEHKGPHIAVEAFKKVKDKNAILHIVGNGPYLDTIKRMAEGDKRIIFHGFVQKKEELDNIFSRCSYFIFPSVWYEIFGLVIIEAMNKGLPVIASNIGAIPELVNDGYNGYLFEAGNVESLHDIIEDSINESTEYFELSKNAYISSKKFLLEDHIKNILNVYSEI